jgi:hypothetical protein
MAVSRLRTLKVRWYYDGWRGPEVIIRSPTGSRTIQVIELMNLLRADQVAPAAVTSLVRVFAQRERQMVTDQRTMRGQSPGSPEPGVD